MITVCTDFGFRHAMILYQLLWPWRSHISGFIRAAWSNHAWYRMGEEDLPEEIADGELEVEEM